MIQKLINYTKRKVNFLIGIARAKQNGIGFYFPNYIYKECIYSNSIIVDVGCANDPDFSLHMIKKYNAFCYGVDPTQKHQNDLLGFTKQYPNKFNYLPFAVASKTQKMTFFESKQNVSGSLLGNHSNVINDEITSYEVEAITIQELRNKVGKDIEVLKLDLEGAEYELLNNINSVEDFEGVNQIFIEFHHHCIKSYSISDTKLLVEKLEDLGFSSFTMDYHNYLFYRK